MIITEAQFKINQLSWSKTLNKKSKNDLIVSAIKLDNENFQVLSRYGDPTWELPSTMFPTVVCPCNQKIMFHRLPEQFREIVKSIIWSYKLEGREGYVKPKGTTIVHVFASLVPFFNYLSKINVMTLSAITPMMCINYVNHQKTYRKKNGKKLALTTLFHQFLAVELIHEISKRLNDTMQYPWPDSSAKLLAGVTGSHPKEGKTKIIPEKILTHLFSETVALLEQADQLLTVRNELENIASLHKHLCVSQIWVKQTKWLKKHGYPNNVRKHMKKCIDLRNACMIIVLTLTGCRAHELAYINNGSVYSTEDSDGNRYLWMRSTSTKTNAGVTEWMIPKIVKRALEVAELLAKPLQDKIKNRINQKFSKSLDCQKIQEQKRHQTAIFIGYHKSGDMIRTLSGNAVNIGINQFANARGIDWHFTEHQFRRTFAVSVAKSVYGDLRYLREHFKHWSLDMTTLYALNEKQEETLFDEVMVAIQNEKIAIVEHWLDDDTLITGGNARGIIEFRKKSKVKTYKDRQILASSVSELVHIRATGHGWCLADNAGCSGKGFIDKTRCIDCINSVIDDRQTYIWKGIYAQQKKLVQLNDIGESGQARVKRDLERCEKVLCDLGVLENRVKSKEDIV